MNTTTDSHPTKNPVYPAPPSPPVLTGYQQTEVGVIPEDWEVRDIKEIASITTGAKNTQDKTDDGRYPFFVRSQKPEKIDTYSYEGEAVLTAGDGVGTGKVFHYINGKFDFHQRVYKISDFEAGVNGYFFYLFFSSSFYDRIMQMTAKSSVDSVRMEMIADMSIPIPTLTEQRAIAQALSDTDALIQSLDQLVAKKRLIKQGAMQQLLRPKPGWGTITFEEAFDFLSTASYSRNDLKGDGDIGYVHYGDIHTLWNSFLDCNHHALPRVDQSKLKGYSLVEEGDLIMADASEDYEGVGKSIEVKNLGDQRVISGLHTFLLRDRNDNFINGYRGYIASSALVKEQLKRLATGLKVYGVSKGNLRSIEIPLPRKEEQQAIAQTLSDMDAEIAALEAKRDKYRQVKQGMMQQLLTGKIRLVP